MPPNCVLRDTLSNLFAGINIMESRQVRPGDYVKLDSGQEGRITDITWRYTTMETLGKNDVIVPNSKMASAIVTNYRLPEDVLTIAVKVGVAHDSDLRKVEEITLDVASDVCREVLGGMPLSEPRMRYQAFGESSIDFTVFLNVTAYADQVPLIHEFIIRLHDRYREEGIRIPFPNRDVHLHDNA